MDNSPPLTKSIHLTNRGILKLSIFRVALVHKAGVAFFFDLKRFLEGLGKDDLIAQTPRSVLQDYVPTENEEEVYRAILDNTNRQLLIGEGC